MQKRFRFVGGKLGVRHIPLSKAEQRPWKNGGGLTREIHVCRGNARAGEFQWRLSYATVSQSGPFSIFPNIDRWIVQTVGDPMTLHFENGTPAKTLEIFVPYAFQGETVIDCRLGASTTEDFNFMVDRRVSRGEFKVVTDCDSYHAAVLAHGIPAFAHMLAGQVTIGQTKMMPGDTLISVDESKDHTEMKAISGHGFTLAVGWVNDV